MQNEALPALENTSLIFRRPSGALVALENVCLMLWLVFALARTRPLTPEPTVVEPSPGLTCFVFAHLQVWPFDDTERKFDSILDDKAEPSFEELACPLALTVVLALLMCCVLRRIACELNDKRLL